MKAMAMAMETTLIKHWSALAGLLVGALLIPITAREWDAWRDRKEQQELAAMHVIESKGRIVARTDDSVTIHVEGTKLRLCAFAGLQAYTVSANGVMTLASVSPDPGTPFSYVTRPIGPFDAGLWIVRPLATDGKTAVIHVLHSCHGVEVRSVLAQVALDGPG